MSELPETVSFNFAGQECPSLESSSGYSALTEASCTSSQQPCLDWTCTYNIELLDWEKNVEELISAFTPNAANGNIAGENERCNGQPRSDECQNWSKINRNVLKRYCQSTSSFSSAENGECPNYLGNPYQPFLPQSRGCNKQMNTNSLCFEWADANKRDGALYATTTNTTSREYCDRVNSSDCACYNANQSVIFSEVNDSIGGDSRCWWRPCEESSVGTFLVPTGGFPTCNQDICVNVNNFLFDNVVIGGNEVIRDLNACGNSKPDKPEWYQQWWFWIIVLAFVVILFAIFIYFASKV